MNEQKNLKSPQIVDKIRSETNKIGFQMTSEPLTGSLLRILAASKPNGNFLELGTGTGVSTAWILDGMNKNSTARLALAPEGIAGFLAQKLLLSKMTLR